jgi:steroid 5-alpha reductase family enzyme
MINNLISILAILASAGAALGIAVAGSSGELQLFGIPLFLACGLIAFSLQWLAFVPAFIFQTERFFDLFGSLTYITLAAIGFFYSGREAGAALVAAMVVIWAVRLGGFLFTRVSRTGHDRRFATIKPDFLQFLMTWTLQGLWVFITFSAGLAALTSGKPYPLDAFVVTGGVLWLAGFLIEIVADQQKSNFKRDPGNRDRFIRHGLWAWSRHPNYFGEILLWMGIAIAAFPILEGWQLATLISPVFVFLLLTRISGVRMLDARADRKWGHEEDYQDYCRNTPVLLLNPRLKASGQVPSTSS